MPKEFALYNQDRLSFLTHLFGPLNFMLLCFVFCTGAMGRAADRGENPRAVLKRNPDVKQNGLIHFSTKW